MDYSNKSFFDIVLESDYDIAEESKIRDYFKKKKENRDLYKKLTTPKKLDEKTIALYKQAEKIQKPILMKITKSFINDFSKNLHTLSNNVKIENTPYYEFDNDVIYTTMEFIGDPSPIYDEIKKCFNNSKEIIKNQYTNEFNNYKISIWLDECDFISIYMHLKTSSKANESFFDTILNEDYDIAEEGRKPRKWNALDRGMYKQMRRSQTSTSGLHIQLIQQRNFIKKDYAKAKQDGTLDEFYNKLERWKKAMQGKINGKEIKDKKTLQKFIAMYDEYLNKRPNNSANESFFDIVLDDSYEIAQEKMTAAQRKALPDNAFGLPKLRKYPLIVKNEETGEYEWDHLRNAIAYFGTCKDEELKKELARNIAKVISKYNVEVKISPNNQIRKYAKFD